MIWDTTYDFRFDKPSPILWKQILQHGETIWREITIGPRLSKPTLAEELAAYGEATAFPEANIQPASRPRPAPAVLSQVDALQSTSFRAKAPMKLRLSNTDKVE